MEKICFKFLYTFFTYLQMKVYCCRFEKQKLYCYYKNELPDIEKDILETGSLSDIATNCPHILFIIQKLYYFKYPTHVTVYKYEDDSLIGKQLVNEEAFSFEWKILGDDENPIIKFAASQTEWSYFDVNKWELINEK